MGTFALDIRKFADKAKGNVGQVVRGVVMEVGKRIVDRSPVGNKKNWLSLRPYQTLKGKSKTALAGPKGYVGGRFRSNWQLGVGVVVNGELYEKSPPATSYPKLQEIIALNAGKIPPNAGGKVYYWCNNLPYAMRLETGWSKQAPAGMVGLVVAEFAGIVTEKAGEVNK